MFLKVLLIFLALYLLFRTFRKQIIAFITRAVVKKMQQEVEKRTQNSHFTHQNNHSQSSKSSSDKKRKDSESDFGEYVDFEEI